MTATALDAPAPAAASSGGLTGVLPRDLGAALVQLPAVWVVAGAAVLLFGALPRAAAAAWGVLTAFLLLGQVGPLLELPRIAMDLSPFTHTPKLPGGDADPLPLAALTAAAAALAAAGLAAFRRRDAG